VLSRRSEKQQIKVKQSKAEQIKAEQIKAEQTTLRAAGKH
jgi:hypothetical protein